MFDQLSTFARNGRLMMATMGLAAVGLGMLSLVACQSQAVQAGELTVTYYYIPR